MADRTALSPRHIENSNYSWVVEDRPLAPSDPDTNTRTVPVATPETSPAELACSLNTVYKCSLEPQTSCTSCDATFYAGDATGKLYPVQGYKYSIDFSTAPYDDGWSISFLIREDAYVGVMIDNIVGGTLGVEVREVLS